MATVETYNPTTGNILRIDGVTLSTIARGSDLGLMLDSTDRHFLIRLSWSEVASLLASLTPFLHARALAAELAAAKPANGAE